MIISPSLLFFFGADHLLKTRGPRTHSYAYGQPLDAIVRLQSPYLLVREKIVGLTSV